MAITLANVPTSDTYTLPTGTEAGTPINLFTGTTLAQTIDSVKVAITSGLQSGDTLASTVTAGSIKQSYASGVLTLTGPDTAANFQAMLDHVQFSTTSTSTADRGLTVTTADGTYTVTATATIHSVVPTVSFFSPEPTPTSGYNVDSPAQPATLGMQFSVTQAGTISAITLYKDARDTMAFEVALFDGSGNAVGTGNYAGSNAQGYITVPLASPVSVTTGVTYTAAYFFPAGWGYADDQNVFVAPTYPKTNNGITVPVNAGVFAYASTLTFPTSTWNGSSYYLDVVFAPSGQQAPPPPPTGLQSIPIAMINVWNGKDTVGPSNDPYQTLGGPVYMAGVLNKTGFQAPANGGIITMLAGVGVNPNYGGDAFVWSSPSEPANYGMPNVMVSVGLTAPSGNGVPTLNQAAAPDSVPLGQGPMDGNWQNAAYRCIYGVNAGDVNGSNPAKDGAPTRTFCIARLGWECTGNWYAWGMNSPQNPNGGTWAADFKQAFRRCAKIFRAAYAAIGGTCLIVFNPNGDYSYPAGIDLSGFYPGDDVVDICAIDIYDQPQYQGGLNASNQPNLAPQDRFNQFVLPNLQAIDAFAKAHGKGVGVCEWGVGAGGENVPFVNGMAAWAAAAASPVKVLGYWNSNSGYPGQLTGYAPSQPGVTPGWAGAPAALPNSYAAFIANFGA